MVWFTGLLQESGEIGYLEPISVPDTDTPTRSEMSDVMYGLVAIALWCISFGVAGDIENAVYSLLAKKIEIKKDSLTSRLSTGISKIVTIGLSTWICGHLGSIFKYTIMGASWEASREIFYWGRDAGFVGSFTGFGVRSLWKNLRSEPPKPDSSEKPTSSDKKSTK